jgi:hypothetical protein
LHGFLAGERTFSSLFGDNVPTATKKEISNKIDDLGLKIGNKDPDGKTRCCGPHITPYPLSATPNAYSPGFDASPNTTARWAEWEVEQLRSELLQQRIAQLQSVAQRIQAPGNDLGLPPKPLQENLALTNFAHSHS